MIRLGKNDKENDNDKKLSRSRILDKRLQNCYILPRRTLNKFFLTVSNSELLDLILKVKECVERNAFQNKKKKNQLLIFPKNINFIILAEF